jgi:beta-lactamase regulating signal transducer with metallopeptidase domain/peptidoglycan/xylan/chitin deacetylase (PgdA/CDA1 family)
MSIETFLGSELVARIGWTLLNSFWQIGLTSIALFLVLRVVHDHSANLRYILAVSALILSVFLPVLTFMQLSTRTQIRSSPESSAGKLDAIVEREAIGSSDSELGRNRGQTSLANTAGISGQFLDVFNWMNRRVPDVLPFAVVVWLIGVMLFSLRLGGGLSRLRTYRTKGVEQPDESWQRAFSRLCDSSGVTQTVRLLSSKFVQTPIAIGVLKPIIIIPASLFLQLRPRELETIIAHELVHIRRFDPIVNLGQCIVESIFFYHPGIWWISAEIRREREFAADAAVIGIFENSHITYARALANLEEVRLRTDQNTPRYSTAANGGNFMQRIQRILKIKTEESSASSAWTAGMALLLTSVFLAAIFSFSSSDVVNAQQRMGSRKLAIGFVSIPPVDRTANPPKDSDATARLLIQKLKEHKVPAIGFLQGGMISDGEKLFPVRANIARMWIDAGLEVGLGGFKHISLHDTPSDEYIANIEKNERVAKQLMGDNRPAPRYFSYPFLNTGKTVEDKAKVESWLSAHGYTSVKYTIDNQEWMYSYAYDQARNDNDVNTMKEIREAYLAYMARMFDHYEAYSAEMFSRDIPQTMVLTPSRLITDTADEFFDLVSKRGYTFVTVEEAQNDPAYKTKEDFTGEAGISWFERWSMAMNRPLRNEPKIDQLIQRIWSERQAAAKE